MQLIAQILLAGLTSMPALGFRSPAPVVGLSVEHNGWHGWMVWGGTGVKMD